MYEGIPAGKEGEKKRYRLLKRRKRRMEMTKTHLRAEIAFFTLPPA